MKIFCSEKDSDYINSLLSQINLDFKNVNIKKYNVIGQDIQQLQDVLISIFKSGYPIIAYAILVNKFDDLNKFISLLATLLKSSKAKLIIKSGDDYIEIDNISQKNLEKIIEKSFSDAK